MPPIQFGCPFCGALAEVDAHLAGKEALCPSCGGLLVVPGDRGHAAQECETSPLPIEIVTPTDTDRVSLRKLWGRSSTSRGKADVETVAPVKTTAPVEAAALTSSATQATRRDEPASKVHDRNKDRQRTVSNLMMLAVGIAVMIVTLAVLLWLSK